MTKGELPELSAKFKDGQPENKKEVDILKAKLPIVKQKGEELKGANKKNSEIVAMLEQDDRRGGGSAVEAGSTTGVKKYADGGRYEGELDADGQCDGEGLFTDVTGVQYRGQFRGGLKHGKGKMAFSDGSTTVCPWQEGMPHGPVTVNYADGKAYVGRCEAGANVGQGVKWSADRAQAWEMENGFTEVRSISLEEAAQIAARIGLCV